MTKSERPDNASSPAPSRDEARFLLQLARRTLAAAVQGNPPPRPDTLAGELGFVIPGSLRQTRGVFVTLHIDGTLRGCIGHIIGVMPLLDGIVSNALAAAFQDPRFLPLDAEELEDVDIEISILSPPRKVAGITDIRIPGHGVVLTKAGAKAVFLPQVAEEQGWDRETLLSHLARKAGLPADGWREGAQFEVFTVESIAEG